MPSVFDELLTLVGSLAARGWAPVFEPHGLDLRSVRSIDDLLAPLPKIDRTQPAFEDFCPEAKRALEPGRPAWSLLYHALAHPGVHPGDAPDEAYARLEELDLLENAIYALAGAELELDGLEVAVFAYQYRPGTRTPHRAHADLVYSRTGIARLGSEPAQWDRAQRSFRVEENTKQKLRVRPARYGAFLARRTKLSEPNIMCGRIDGDEDRTFLVPVHKLFRGNECLKGRKLDIEWREYHRNEKLARAIEPGGLEFPKGKTFDIAKPPFLRTSHDVKEPVVELVECGDSVLVAPPPAPLVRVARQNGEIVSFEVKGSLPWCLRKVTREFTTLHHISNKLAFAYDWAATKWWSKYESHRARRDVPEYLNIRHRVSADGKTLENLNELSDDDEFKKLVRHGGYRAALFEDSICDGCVTAVVTGLGEGRTHPAFSVLGPADFFPRVDQADLRHRLTGEDEPAWPEVFSHGTPEPLCMGRLFANPAIKDPIDLDAPAFDERELTMVAVVSEERPRPTTKAPPSARKRSGEGPVSWMPDGAAGHFAPGWEVTFDRERKRAWYHTYGLGSPFVEDLKLCSAGSGSWPAVAPDASRTFGRMDHPTSMLLLDRELGFHEQHPLVNKKVVEAARGWDGEYGPFFEHIEGGKGYCVNYADIDRSDYVANSLDKLIRADLVSHLDTDDLLARVRALRWAIDNAGPTDDSVIKTKLWLITAHAVEDWTTREDRLDAALAGAGFELVFAVAAHGEETRCKHDPSRLRVPVTRVVTCHIGQSGGKVVGKVSDERSPL